MTRKNLSLLLVVLSFMIALPFSYAGEKDLYDFLWLDPDKQVYVLQNKIYPKKNTFYVDIGYLDNLTNEFQDTNGAMVKMGYFLSEDWGLELNYIQYTSKNNSAYESIKVINGTDPFIRRTLNSTSLFVIWSPFYGKINTFNKIFYFDWYFGLGSGQLNAESNLKSVTNPNSASSFDKETYNPLQFKTGVKFHINRHIHLGVEFLNHNFQAGSPKKPSSNEWKQSNDLIFSIGASF